MKSFLSLTYIYIYRILRRISTNVRVFLPIKRPKNTAENVIISLTSYPARLKNLHKVIRSLLHQKLKAKNIILYLGTDTKSSDIPKKLLRLQKFGLIIKTDYPDIKPHKKYFFVMQEYPENTIITVDDDAFYDKNLVFDLTECAKKNPNCVIARRVNLITKTEQKLNNYKDFKWEYTKITEPSHALLATGCGGVLYPAKIFPKEIFNLEIIKNYCLNTDDIYLKFMELKYNIPVVFSDSRVIHPLSLRNSQKSALMIENTENKNQNDLNIQKMQEITGINLSDFAQEI